MGQNRLFRFTLLAMLLAAVLVQLVHGEETASEATVDANGGASDDIKEKEQKKKKEGPKVFPEKQWGTYYDPSNIFCGQYDCYKILGFDYESWGKNPPNKKEITQSYRQTSRTWHPDKNSDKGAKERFVKINKAYEVLTDLKTRKEYDYMRERPDEYFFKYGSTMYQYAPKSDTIMVVIFLLILGCAFTWFAQKQRWQQIADRVVKDATEGLKANEGGSTESIELRRKAETILKERNEKESGETSESQNGKKKLKIKLTKKELREKENEELRPIIAELVQEITDFGAGFHQPTWRDILIVRMVKWPQYVLGGCFWQIKYGLRRLRKLELNDDEIGVLTRRAVGPVAWETASDEDKEEMLTRELWVMENLEEWLEEMEIRQLSSGMQKRYNRMKKLEAKKGKKTD